MAVPTDIPNLIAWYKADAITGLATGATVASWVDSSTGAHAATQATNANKPKYITNVRNALPVVRFNGTTNTLTSAAASGGAQETIFAVCSSTSAAAGGNCVKGGSANGSTQYRHQPTASPATLVNPVWLAQGTTQFPAGATQPVASWHVNSASCQSGTGAGWLYATDGKVDVVGGATVTFVAGTSFIGSIGTTEYFAGDIAEVFWYNRVLTPAERQSMESYLGTKYAIPITTPPSLRRRSGKYIF